MLNLYSPRHIRLIRGVVTCPKCNATVYHSTVQAGRAFQQCEHKRAKQPQRCDAEWLCLALPPECFGGWLAATVGEHEAKLLIAKCWPHFGMLSVPDLWYAQLVEGNEPAWIQVAVRPRERHLYRTAKITDFLPLLLRPAA